MDVVAYLKALSGDACNKNGVAAITKVYSDNKVPADILITASQTVCGRGMVENVVYSLLSAGADPESVVAAAISSGANAGDVVKAATKAGADPEKVKVAALNAGADPTTLLDPTGAGRKQGGDDGRGGGFGGGDGHNYHPIGTPVPGGGGGGRPASRS
ncbi:MAG: hypothetical protein COS39_00950 [Hydrogenophilales bacterium CG03_land_8_20_14_0_80_62_28]|nr:MAG: hypothetical protein AUJ86_00990 [Hydrogenophilaceae bacterium CG1_02_62_390]PIV24496.1 MAG: hypothetical protein COS39_00950 [Hydrogenophilales bacterium CG03_land_8_20_14_0_80_62_28]PIY98215.1 MAG: hypothetical protein COY64_07175 [Hydrogenophilales bacterium CG_4_10_14_0_8_um_filter_62_70]